MSCDLLQVILLARPSLVSAERNVCMMRGATIVSVLPVHLVMAKLLAQVVMFQCMAATVRPHACLLLHVLLSVIVMPVSANLAILEMDLRIVQSQGAQVSQ